MTFDDMLRDGSSFGKLTNLCYLNVSFSLLLVLFKVSIRPTGFLVHVSL